MSPPTVKTTVIFQQLEKEDNVHVFNVTVHPNVYIFSLFVCFDLFNAFQKFHQITVFNSEQTRCVQLVSVSAFQGFPRRLKRSSGWQDRFADGWKENRAATAVVNATSLQMAVPRANRGPQGCEMKEERRLDWSRSIAPAAHGGHELGVFAQVLNQPV